MKNILVLTDFSAAARHAADCALPAAARLGADVLLVHVYPITPYLPPAGLAAWPLDTAGKKRRESTAKLNREARRLVKRLPAPQPSGHSPLIRPVSLEGQLADCAAGLARRKKSVLIMMGASPNSYGGLLFDGDVKAVLQQVACPVLVIPGAWAGPEIGHFLFATGLEAGDEPAIAELVRLAGPLQARISLSHVSRPVLVPDFAEEVRVAAFIEKIRDRFPGIGYYLARNVHILGALERLSAEKHADAIAWRFHPHAPWYRLFRENPLQEAIENLDIPLLIFPEKPHSHD